MTVALGPVQNGDSPWGVTIWMSPIVMTIAPFSFLDHGLDWAHGLTGSRSRAE
jgi:hypothetical protein